MTAETEIRNLIFRYARAIDEGRFNDLGVLFSRGRILFDMSEESGAAVGENEVTALYERTTRRYENGTPNTHHLTSNIEIAVDKDSASSISYFTVFQSLPDFDLQPIIAGKYFDTFVLHTDGWWFETRSMGITLTGDLSKHLLIDI